MTEILTAFQTFGIPGAILMATGLAFKYVWPDIRDALRAQTTAFKALADLARATDQRLANIERATAETNEGMGILVDREVGRKLPAQRRPAAQGAR